MIPNLPSDPYDAEVLRIARELAERLQLPSKFEFQRIIWSSELHWHSSGAASGVRKITELSLPASLRGRLEPEDWRFLLANTMFDLKFARRAAAFVILPFLGIILAVAGSGIYLSGTFGVETASWFERLVATPAIIILLLGVARYGKRKYLEFWKETASMLGKDALLRVLRRIDQMGVPDVENAKNRNRILRWLWIFPNITEVINYVEQLS